MKYTIPKGKHRAKPVKIGLYTRQEFKWKVAFDQSAAYNIGENQGDINKLCGIRYLFGDHSARFGWRYDPIYPNMVEILAYVHDAGQVTKSEDEVVIGKIPFIFHALLCLCIKNKEYVFQLNAKTVKIKKNTSQKISFRQNPYFGGICKSPHDITIDLTNL